MMFKVIENENKLPSGPRAIINIQAETKVEAHVYANRFPEREIYWIEDKQMGVWFQHIRRENDV